MFPIGLPYYGLCNSDLCTIPRQIIALLPVARKPLRPSPLLFLVAPADSQPYTYWQRLAHRKASTLYGTPGSSRSAPTLIDAATMLQPDDTAQIGDSVSTTFSVADVPVTPRDAPYPFDNPRADVVLQSSDGVRFRVRKAILSEASPVFESMFTLPAITQFSEGPHNESGVDSPLPSVLMAEDGSTLEALLRMCYPVDEKSLDPLSLDGLVPVLVAARKYDMNRTEKYITQRLRQLVATSPLRGYCLSIRFQIGNELTRAAARGFLAQGIRSAYVDIHIRELDDISGSAYARLLDYHSKCSVAVLHVIDTHSDTQSERSERCWWKCRYQVHYGSNHCGYVDSFCAAWFSRFLDQWRRLVEDKPSGYEVQPQNAMAEVLTEAAKCDYCRPQVWNHLQGFLRLMTARMDAAITQVSSEVFPS